MISTPTRNRHPIIVFQHNWFREGYFKASATIDHGRNEWKAGVESDNIFLNEMLNYNITDPTQFDPGSPLTFAYRQIVRIWSSRSLCRIRSGCTTGLSMPACAGTTINCFSTSRHCSRVLPFRITFKRPTRSCISLMTGYFKRHRSRTSCCRVRHRLQASIPQAFLNLPVRPSHGRLL